MANFFPYPKYYKGTGTCLTCLKKISHDVQECPHCGKKKNSWGAGPTDLGKLKHQFSTTRGKVAGSLVWILVPCLIIGTIIGLTAD